jgi:hypothetical protein
LAGRRRGDALAASALAIALVTIARGGEKMATWEYTVSPKLWDTDDEFTHMLNTAQRELAYEFVGAVKLGGWEHHVWRRPMPKKKFDTVKAWTAVLATVANRSGKKPGARARRFLRSLAAREQASPPKNPKSKRSR